MNITDAVIGGILAFACAAIAVGTDAQTEIRTRFGRRHGTFILNQREGYAFILFWGAVDVVFFVVFLHNHDWAKRAFNIDIEQSLIWAGIVVGLSAILIIRTNLATVGNFQIGGELLYSLSRAFLIDKLNRVRVRARRTFIGGYRPYFKDTQKYPKYFASLEGVLKELAPGSDRSGEIGTQLSTIKAEHQKPDDSAEAREALTGLMYDYFGPREVKSWADETDYGNKH